MFEYLIELMLTDTGETSEDETPEEEITEQNTEPDADSPDDGSAEIADAVRRVQGGDSEAFSLIVSTYERYVYNIAVRILTPSSLTSMAEDVAQSAFIKAWKSINSFRGDCALSTWLYRITVNTAKDTIRSASRRKTVSLTKDGSDDEDEVCEWDVPVTSGSTVPESELERKEIIRDIRRAIEELPEEQRRVIIMRDIHDLPYTDIAKALGLELGTVKSRINRGRAALKEILKTKYGF